MDLSNLDSHIRRSFSALHSDLYVAERNIQKQLETYTPASSTDFQQVYNDIAIGIKKVTQLLNYFNVENKQQINSKTLQEEAAHIRNLPCELTVNKNAVDPLKMFSCQLENIENKFSLNANSLLECKLEAMHTLVEPDDSSTDLVETESDSLACFEIVDEVNSASLEEPFVLEAPKRKSAYLGRNRGDECRVVLTHLNSFDSFYVQKYVSQHHVEAISVKIEKKQYRKVQLNELRIGHIYSVLYEDRKSSSWRRGKVLEYMNASELCQVFFIDYGNIKYVSLENIRCLDLYLVKRAPYAFECKLTNPTNIIHESNSYFKLIPIIEDQELYLKFMKRYEAGVREVDLFIPTFNGDLISVRTLLKANLDSTELPMPFVGRKLFKNSQKFALGHDEQVVITHIKNPFQIYVQLVKNIGLINKMSHEMLNSFQNRKLKVFKPVEGSDAIVKYEHSVHGVWHRSTVGPVNEENKTVEVFFVDWGLTTNVEWTSVFHLPEHLTKLECQGLCIRLADVETRSTDGNWDLEATVCLREHLEEDNKCKMVVSKTEPLEVALFQTCPGKDVCLNALLVEEGFAQSSGIISQTLYWPNGQEITVVCDDDDFIFDMLKKSQQPLIQSEAAQVGRHDFKQKVEIICCKGPDTFSVRFTKFTERIDDLRREMQIHYSTTQITKTNWTKDEFCAIYDTRIKSYFRGIIVEEVDALTLKVLIWDMGRTVPVKKTLVFVLEPYFTSIVNNVLTCRLSNIRPAGNGDKWSNTANEILQKIIATYKTIYVTKVEEDAENKQIGVVMWYTLAIPGTALEPSKNYLLSVNETLVECGVALNSKTGSEVQACKKQANWFDLCCEEEENNGSTDEGTSVATDNNVTETTVTQWPPARKISKREFTASLICVDSEGVCLLRDDEIVASYKEIEDSMRATLLDNVFDEAQVWSPGDVCSVLCNDLIYRGTIIEVLPHDITVEMIDFGSVHNVNEEKLKLSRHVMYIDKAPCIYKTQLSNVSHLLPHCYEEFLDKISDSVNVVMEPAGEAVIPFAELYLDDGKNMRELIMELHAELELHLELDRSFSRFSYTFASIPFADKGEPNMYIVDILKTGKKFKAILSTQSPKSTGVDDKLGKLIHEIQQSAQDQSNVRQLQVGKPCVCLSKAVWWRALIFNTIGKERGCVQVLLVDQARLVVVDVTDIRIMKPEWFNYPVHNVVANIGIELVDDNMAEVVTMDLNNLRLKKVSVFEVCGGRESLTVDLFNEEGVLYYQHLIDCGFIALSSK